MVLLKKGIEKIGFKLDEKLEKNLSLYLSELKLWEKRGLVKAGGDDLIVRHFLDCIAAFPYFPPLNKAKCADLGSGAGFPGLLAALFFPEADVSLIERKQSRAAFLSNYISLAGIGARTRSLALSAEDLTGCFDYVMFRAFRPVSAILDLLTSFLNIGSTIISMQGKKAGAEQDASLFNDYKTEIIPVYPPYLDEERHLLIIGDR